MPKVLAIDDIEVNLVLLKALLLKSINECKVTTTQSGEKGLEIAKKEHPDTILLDVVMPEMDGYEVCRRLKLDELTRHIPVILMTAIRSDSKSRVEGFKTGADAFISKPVDEAELVAQVNVMLRIKKAEDKLRSEKERLDYLVNEKTKELKISEEKYRELANSLPEIIYETDVKGNLSFVNRNAYDTFGYTVEEFEKGLNVIEMLIPEDRERALKNFQRILGGYESDGYEYTALKKNGTNFPVVIYSTPIIRDNKPAGLRGIIIDISERKRTERIQSSLYKISEAANTSGNLGQLYNSIHEIMKDLLPADNLYIALYDKDNDVISFPYFVDEYDEMQPPRKFGKGITEYVLRNNKPLLATPEDVFSLREKGEIEFIGEIPVDWLGVPLKVKDKTIGVIAVQSYDGKVRYNSNDKDVLIFVSEQIAMAIESVRAADEIKQSSEQLRSLVARVQSIREDEKLRMRYGIREDLIQTLAVLRMDLTWIDKKFKEEQEVEHSKVKSMMELLDKISKEVQKTSEELRSSHLDHLGIDAAINWFMEEFQKRTGIQFQVEYKLGDHELNKNISITLYRILEELMKNVEEHANARNVTISLELNNNVLKMKVRDDGKGIEEDKIKDSKSLGLIDIKERLNQFKGEIFIKGIQSKGTIVTVSIPLDKISERGDDLKLF